MNKWMKRRIERSRARCERAEAEKKETSQSRKTQTDGADQTKIELVRT